MKPTTEGQQIRVRGLVQGVGFRPHVWHLARNLGLAGDVRNDGDGVLIRLWTTEAARLETFYQRLQADAPPLARIDSIHRAPLTDAQPGASFEIIPSAATAVHTSMVPDAATCCACAAELTDAGDRRYRYPFINCTHCGPRLSILDAIPYDRANTSMASFPMCEACSAEYRDPANRRFHAQPNACPACGPRAWLEDTQGQLLQTKDADAIGEASRRLAAGAILAIKGIGGFHLACDATQTDAVERLRQRKARDAKPFALMARNLEVIRRYVLVGDAERALLTSAAAPIVLLERRTPSGTPGGASPDLAPGVAPGQSSLGFMLPYSPVHHLLLQDWEHPLVMTSGNRSDEPQAISNSDAHARLGPLADALLLHDRDIRNRLDDSVSRVSAGQTQLLRRARGYAPAPLPLPDGFRDAPPILALGGELKNTFCLLDAPQLILSQHLGDLDEPTTAREFERTLALYRQLFQHRPKAIAIDLHPDYHCSQRGRALADEEQIPLVEVQHHFAHIAAVMADNAWPRHGGAVIGVALDGFGYGSDATAWGGEFLRVDYGSFTRLACLRPVPLPGADRAALEPWRNLIAQLHWGIGLDQALRQCPALRRHARLDTKPLQPLVHMMETGLNAPTTSSAGRLFDAVAAALGCAAERLAYEGQAAMELEALAKHYRRRAAAGVDHGYPFGRKRSRPGLQLDPTPMWQALLADIQHGRDPGQIALRFHYGLAQAVVSLAAELASAEHLDTLALSGGVFQNQVLLEAVIAAAERAGLRTLHHRQVPSNDGGLAIGQALAAAAILEQPPRTTPD